MFTHINEDNRPTMVDVGDKAVTHRTASARAVVIFPEEAFKSGEDVLQTKKGPVVDTAIVAGVLAAKRTHEFIPFCHLIPLEDCSITIEWNTARELVIQCSSNLESSRP